MLRKSLSLFLKIFSFPAVITNDKEFEAYSFSSFVADCRGSFVRLCVKKVKKSTNFGSTIGKYQEHIVALVYA